MSVVTRFCQVVALVFFASLFSVQTTYATGALSQQLPLPAPELHYQVTDAALTVENLVADPALLHNFSPLTPKQATIRTTEQQAVWLLAKINNPYPEALAAVLSYHFLPADKVSMYKLAKDLPNAELLGHMGSDFPFAERPLPLHSFSQPIRLERAEQAIFLLRLQDAALLGTELSITPLPQLLLDSQRQLAYDSIINGILLLLVLLALYRGLQQRQPALYPLAGFYLAFLLVLNTLNGMAFSLLWPENPELNPVLLYISVGITLVFLTVFNRTTLPDNAGRFARYMNTGCLLVALALLFSPLYADGPLKLKLLFSCVSFILAATVLQALYTSLTSNVRYSSRFSLLAAAATLNLLLVQTRYLSSFAHWLNAGLFILVAFSAVLLLSIPRHTKSSAN
ncbi:7TM diverse intracellular signaling domain-containing protein [Alishewanella longhuensis]